MVFDKLCGIVERHFPFLKKTLDDAKIFQFEGIPHQILPSLFEGKTKEEVNGICTDFFLPYQTIAIEDGASCMILHDEKPDQIGIDKERFYLEAMMPTLQNEYFDFKVSHPDVEFIKELQRKGVLVINYGKGCILQWDNDHFGSKGSVLGAFAVNKKDIIMNNVLERLDSEHVRRSCLQNFVTALQEVMFFNQPDKFILEKRPVKKKKLGKGWIARSIWRPTYTILHPAEIRKRMNVHHSHRGPIIDGFDRRRHVRYLSHEMYSTDDSGAKIEPKVIPNGPRRGELYYKKTIIPATWVGPSESIIGNKRYKVILDR